MVKKLEEIISAGEGRGPSVSGSLDRVRLLPYNAFKILFKI
jgi:hypothetical protein